MTGAMTRNSDFDGRDAPSAEFIAEMRSRYPTEREIDQLLVRKLERRAGPPYRRIDKGQLGVYLRKFLTDNVTGDFDVADERWLVGGASKIQLAFTLTNEAPGGAVETRRMVVRMDPSESLNATSRTRELEMLRAFRGVVPVPEAYWVDAEAHWFPEPALVYAYADGVTRPSDSPRSGVSGVGTVFGERLRATLADQFMDHLTAIHTFRPDPTAFTTLDVPEVGTDQGALWQLNRARRVWEEDRGEDVALMEVAAGWMERNLPVLDRVSVVHGDFRSGNFLFDDASGRVSAWLDWERSHLGDRHRDLAWTTQKLFGHYLGAEFLVCGLVSESDFYRRYEALSGLTVDPDRLRFYKILNCFQLVVSTLASAYRVTRLAKTHQDVVLARVRGEAPVLLDELSQLLDEVL